MVSAFDAARKMIFWTISTVVFSLIVVSFVLIIAGYRDKLADPPAKIEAEFIALRFANIPECFAYEDKETGRVYQASIDLAAFTQEQMDKCYHTDTANTYNFELELKETAKKIRTNNYKENFKFTLIKDVLVWDGIQFKKDILVIYVQEDLRP